MRCFSGVARGVLAPAAAVVVGLGAWACAKTQAKQDQDGGTKLSAAEQKVVDEYRAEIEIGRNMAGRLLAYYGAIEGQSLLGYLNQVGSYVASYSDNPERRYMFAVLRHEGINAFACPGGYILVTMGALRAATNEAELAAILGHEVAHVGKKHMLTTLQKMSKDDIDKAAAARAKREKDDPILQQRERPAAEETGAGAMLARYLSGSSGAAINILQAAQAGMSLITSTGLDKNLEYEADGEGVRYAIRAGYMPSALTEYLGRIGAKKTHIANLEKTHPSVNNRLERIKKVLVEMSATDLKGSTGEDRFNKAAKTFPKPEN